MATRRRARSAVGGTRVSLFWQLVGLAVLLSSAVVVAPAVVTVATVYLVVRVIVVLLFDRQPQGNGLIMGMLRGIPMWYLKLWKWAILGSDFPGFVPSRA